VLALISCGQLFVVLVGCIDLSVGSLIGVSSVVTTLTLLEWGFLPGLTAGLLTGVVLGAANGLVVSYLRIPPMIATLAMLYFAKGAALTITGGMPVERLPKAFGVLGKGSVFGLPFPMMIAILLFAVCYFVLAKIPAGRNIYAVGGSEENKPAGRNRRASLQSARIHHQRVHGIPGKRHPIVPYELGTADFRRRT